MARGLPCGTARNHVRHPHGTNHLADRARRRRNVGWAGRTRLAGLLHPRQWCLSSDLRGDADDRGDRLRLRPIVPDAQPPRAALGGAKSMNVAADRPGAALWRRLRRCCSVLLMLAIWEGAARSGLVSSFLLPAASDVLANLWRMVTEGQLLYHTFQSLMRASAGLGLALVLAIPLGLIRARSRLDNS